MTHRALHILSHAALAAALAACGPDDGTATASASTPAWSRVADTVFSESTAAAVTLDSAWLDSSGPPFQLLALPDSVRDYEMTEPTSVAVKRDGSCLLAVTDQYETAVHFFSSPTRYEGSRSLGGNRRNSLRNIGNAVIGPQGITYLNEMGRRRLVSLDRARDSFRVFQSAAITAEMPRIVDLEPVSANRLIENWMAPSLPMASLDWAREELPLLRIIDSLGSYMGGLWRIAERPGHLLTHSLNQGFLARQGDTLSFAYMVSGQVLRGVLDTSSVPWVVKDTSRIVLPRMYDPMPPEWYRRTEADTGSVTVDYQVSGFAVTGNGHMIVGQTISYPPRGTPGTIHQPVSAVVIYDRSGRAIRGWRVGGRVRGLAAGNGILAVNVDQGKGRKVRIYRLSDVMPGGGASGECSEGN